MTRALLVVGSEGGLITITGPNLTAEALRQGVRWAAVTGSVTLALMALYFVTHIIQDARRATGKMPTAHWAVRFLTGNS